MAGKNRMNRNRAAKSGAEKERVWKARLQIAEKRKAEFQTEAELHSCRRDSPADRTLPDKVTWNITQKQLPRRTAAFFCTGLPLCLEDPDRNSSGKRQNSFFVSNQANSMQMPEPLIIMEPASKANVGYNTAQAVKSIDLRKFTEDIRKGKTIEMLSRHRRR